MTGNENKNNSEPTSCDSNKHNSQSLNDPSEVEEIVAGHRTFDDFIKTSFGIIQNGVKSANSLPAGDNFHYYACFPSFNQVCNNRVRKIENLMQKIVELCGVAGSMKYRDTDEKLKLLTDTNDFLLDKTSVALDEETDMRKKNSVELVISQTEQNNCGSWNISRSTGDRKFPQVMSNIQAVRLLGAKNIQRPQLAFTDKIDNSPKPWVPRIKEKPNAIKPLEIYLIDGKNGQMFCHPYNFELDHFVVPQNQLEKAEPIKFAKIERTPLVMVEKLDDLHKMLNDLKNHHEIAVDLEHHAYRTFQGITCLMQISTRDTDYLIDTLSLRSELCILNEIFTKPSILKVFHGADLDIQWLQRDLSLYIINMFDTHQAAKQLNLPYLSLSYLLKTYCNVDPNKHFQLADWRIRPLPDDLINYAREDTHYLLYIKDILHNALIDTANGNVNILRAVYDRSTLICKQVYEKPVCDETSYLNMYRKSKKMFNNRQLYALKQLYLWRDMTAREEDDSVGYVLPNHMLLNIAETLPREMQGILACCNPIPPLVRQHLLKLHKLILRAREQSLIKSFLEQDRRNRVTQVDRSDVENLIFSPHDSTHGIETQANLTCLLDVDKLQESTKAGGFDERQIEWNEKFGELDGGNRKKSKISMDLVNVEHIINVFDSPPNSDGEENSAACEKFKKIRTLFISPHDRYKLVIPMIAAGEQERLQKDQEEKDNLALENEMVQEKGAVETADSIERVHQHFLNTVNEKSTEITEIVDEHQSINRNNFIASLSDIKGTKKRKRKSSHTEDKVETQLQCEETNVKFQKIRQRLDEQKEDSKGFSAFSVSGCRRKNQKKLNRQELHQKGMLPSANFDYKEVDFSSFGGGSQRFSSKITTPKVKEYREKQTMKRKRQRKLGI